MTVPEGIVLPYSDFYNIIDAKMNKSWETVWKTSRDKLLTRRDHVGKWPNQVNFTRKDEVVFNRQRVGHTLLNSDVYQGPPGCEMCMEATMTVKHILIQCNRLKQTRKHIFGKENVSLKDLLGGKIDMKTIIFVRTIGMYERV